MNIHYTTDYLLNPTHQLTVDLIGCGGTGIQVLNGLARMNEALLKLGGLGLFVTLYDPDTITEANAGRQLFSSSDIGQYKSVIALTRINRFFGTQWESCPIKYPDKSKFPNIVISCVDNVETRLQLDNMLKFAYNPEMERYGVQSEVPFYWLDFGNTLNSGQVVLGTAQPIRQPASKHRTVKELPTVIDLFPQIENVIEDNEPSCSLAEALNKQDLYINSTLAQYGLALLWKLFKEAYITVHGAFINLETFKTNPIVIQ